MADEPGTSIADQTVAQLGGRTSILARQRADHARLARLMTPAAQAVERLPVVRRGEHPETSR